MAENSTQNIETGGIQEYRQPDLTYRMGESAIVGKITDRIESVKQSILHILSTERYSNPIYDDDYGIELEKYIGQDKGTVIADIENTYTQKILPEYREGFFLCSKLLFFALTVLRINTFRRSVRQRLRLRLQRLHPPSYRQQGSR